MENNYSSKYSGEQVDAAVEYFLRHSQTEESSYDYNVIIFCEATSAPSQPFASSSLPVLLPTEFPFAGADHNLWYDVPNTPSKNWYQCTLRVNSSSNKVVSQGAVISLTGGQGNDGQNGQDGQDGKDGNDGNDGKNGNYTEFRYKRSSQYAIVLTETQKNSRYPSGWSTNWDTVDVESYSELLVSLEELLETYLSGFSPSSLTVANTNYFTTIPSNPVFYEINTAYSDKHGGLSLIANEEQQALIVEFYKKAKAIYDRCEFPSTTETPLACNTDYHKIWKDYVDEDHFWALFQINAVISGEDESLVRRWSNPQRLSGVDGKPGPKGSNGIDGIPGVSIAIAFTLGTEEAVRPDAADPTESPYNTNYNALFQPGTKWSKESPTVNKSYPYIWFTQCRYLVTEDNQGNKTYKFEDTWSVPQRYTGLNGITTHETVYTRNPIIYPAGIFALNTDYTNDGNRTPYVYYDGNYYYLSGQGTFTSDSDTSNPKTATAWWTLMEHFEALFAQVGIIANGLVGSAVFNGDYMFSQQGQDHNGYPSTHYEGFMIHYNTGMPVSTPYDSNAAFTPNICINFRTGQLWSRTFDEALGSAKSEIITTATGISMSVKEQIDGELRQAGINIDTEGVHITGEFTGTMGGTFNGKVSAKSLEVLGDSGTPVIVFDTYKSYMGTPSGGTAPDEGTPVLLINHNGAQYLVSMIKLVTGSSSGTYRQTDAVIEDLYTTDYISASVGTQGSKNYHAITKAPYLTLLNSDGTATSNTIAAKLYNSNGSKELKWSDYLNKYYSGTLIQEYSEKTDLGAGIWAFKLVGSLATGVTTYNGTPTINNVAALGILTTSVEGNRPQVTNKTVYFPLTANVYTKITITNGVLKENASDNVATCKYTYINDNGNITTGGGYRFLAATSSSAYNIYSTSGSAVSSDYFMDQSSTRSTLTKIQIISSAAIVAPQIQPTIPDLAT